MDMYWCMYMYMYWCIRKCTGIFVHVLVYRTCTGVFLHVHVTYSTWMYNITYTHVDEEYDSEYNRITE